MQQLIIKSNQLVSSVNLKFRRYLTNHIDWTWRLNGIIGARGTGKTTMLLQQIKEKHGNSKSSIYISLDDLYFSENTLTEFITDFVNLGGRFIYIDEVHKYKNWSRELKNIYDTFPDLTITFTGSSIIDILNEDADLSRRAIMYNLNGLSFREYLLLSGILDYNHLSLVSLLENHVSIAIDISSKIKPLQHFQNYLEIGYYPYFLENISMYYRRIEQVLIRVLEGDLGFIEGFDRRNVQKIKQLLYILSVNVPFKPNIIKLSEKTKISRNALVAYLHYLEKAQIIQSIYPGGISSSILQKPEKIYLNNTNLAFLLSNQIPDKGNLRETFFLNQLKCLHTVKSSKTADFEVDESFTFEIGGKNKNMKQIAGQKNAYIVSDNIEAGAYNRIPLWLFGFLY